MTVSDEQLQTILAGLGGGTPSPAPNAGAAPPKPWCRARCGAKLDPVLVDREDNSGLHIGCEQAVDAAVDSAVQGYRQTIVTLDETHVHAAEPAGPPPSTIAELRRVLIDFEAQRPRSMQTRLGPSELGTPCQQQIARKLAGAPRRAATEPSWAPFIGTAVHASMEDVVAFWNAQLGRERWVAEDDLLIDPGMEGVEKVAGHGDAFDKDASMVVDWKVTGTTARDKILAAQRAGKPPAEQVSAEYRTQIHLYGLGHERKGREVRFVRLVLLARSHKFDESVEWTEPYQPDIALKALERYYATHDLLAALDVANHPERITAIPASPSNDACAWCPFRRPGRPSDWTGCAGDEAAQQRRMDRFTDGLIAP